MNNTLQLHLGLATPEQTKRAWAFAKDTRSAKQPRRRTYADYQHCVITAASKEAKILGVTTGMRYLDAKHLVPGMKILVIGDRKK